MKKYIAVVFTATVALGLIAPAEAQRNSEAETLLAAAQQKERLEGDPNAAIKQYAAIISKYSKTNREVTAMALVGMAECYQDIGDAQAKKIYEQVVRDYTDQKDAVVLARIALDRGRNASSGAVAKRMVCSNCDDNEAQFSPDGRTMVFTDWDTGDIAVRDIPSGKVRRLLAKTGTFRDSDLYGETPNLSPDLRQVVYLWEGEKTEQLRVMENEPGAKSRVLVDTPEFTYYEPHGWFPDNKSVLVLMAKADDSWQLARVSVPDGSIKVLKSHCCTGTTMSISPDGKFIAYSARVVNPDRATRFVQADAKDQHIYILASDGSSDTEIVRAAGVNTNCVWTPDGKHILFTSDRSGNVDLWSIAVENGKAVGAESVVSPAIGEIFTYGMHGGSYYYEPKAGPTYSVSIADLNPAGGKNQGAQNETFVGQSPSWSPDGKSVAMKRPHPGGSPGTYDLVVRSLETGAERAYLTNLGTTGSGVAAWFHDGKSIATEIHRKDGSVAVYRVDLKTGVYINVLMVGTGPVLVAPDDKTLYLVRHDTLRGEIVVSLDLDTGQERELFTPRSGVIGNSLRLSPDGSTLAFILTDPIDAKQIRIVCVDVDGRNYREVLAIQSSYVRYGNLAWSKDSHGVLFEQRKVKGDPFQIMRVASAGGMPEPTGFQVTDYPIVAFDPSPDGSRIALSTYKRPDDLWALDNILPALK